MYIENERETTIALLNDDLIFGVLRPLVVEINIPPLRPIEKCL